MQFTHTDEPLFEAKTGIAQGVGVPTRVSALDYRLKLPPNRGHTSFVALIHVTLFLHSNFVPWHSATPPLSIYHSRFVLHTTELLPIYDSTYIIFFCCVTRVRNAFTNGKKERGMYMYTVCVRYLEILLGTYYYH